VIAFGMQRDSIRRSANRVNSSLDVTGQSGVLSGGNPRFRSVAEVDPSPVLGLTGIRSRRSETGGRKEGMDQ